MTYLAVQTIELSQLALALALLKGHAMNENIASGKWKQFKGEIQRKWGKLTNDDLDRIDGNRDKLVGRLQEAYGVKRESIEKDVADFFDGLVNKNRH